jgi:hypothetical protein
MWEGSAGYRIDRGAEKRSILYGRGDAARQSRKFHHPEFHAATASCSIAATTAKSKSELGMKHEYDRMKI